MDLRLTALYCETCWWMGRVWNTAGRWQLEKNPQSKLLFVFKYLCRFSWRSLTMHERHRCGSRRTVYSCELVSSTRGWWQLPMKTLRSFWVKKAATTDWSMRTWEIISCLISMMLRTWNCSCSRRLQTVCRWMSVFTARSISVTTFSCHRAAQCNAHTIIISIIFYALTYCGSGPEVVRPVVWLFL